MNSELFPPALLAQLDKIGQLFVWRRKTLRDSMIEALQVANRSHEALALDPNGYAFIPVSPASKLSLQAKG